MPQSLVDTLKAKADLVPPSHTVRPEDVCEVVSALLAYHEYGDAFLNCATPPDVAALYAPKPPAEHAEAQTTLSDRPLYQGPAEEN